jgi:hypothetical protein
VASLVEGQVVEGQVMISKLREEVPEVDDLEVAHS